MTFFNRKEEVIEIELTPHGKYLLSLGEWEPVYYAFFDDDITYDSNYISYKEDQNNAEKRIQEAVRPRNQVVFRDVADESRSSLQYDKRHLQCSFEREHALSSELGIAGYYSNKSPAWDVDFLKGHLTGSTLHYTGSGPIYNIPQVNVKDPTYKKIIGTLATGLGPEPLFDEDLREIINFREDFLEIREDFILLEINENNSSFQKENFEIELFEVVKETDRAGNNFENLKPLKFSGPRNGNGTEYVDYYFNVRKSVLNNISAENTLSHEFC